MTFQVINLIFIQSGNSKSEFRRFLTESGIEETAYMAISYQWSGKELPVVKLLHFLCTRHESMLSCAKLNISLN